MGYLAFLLVTLLALAGFFVLVEYEARRGVRVLAAKRAALDGIVDRAVFIWSHVDLVAFGREELRALLNRGSHTVAHLILRAVRLLERLLTRIVRHLRSTAVESEAPRETAREFVRTLSDFKETLGENRPDVSVSEERRKEAEDRRAQERRNTGTPG